MKKRNYFVFLAMTLALTGCTNSSNSTDTEAAGETTVVEGTATLAADTTAVIAATEELTTTVSTAAESLTEEETTEEATTEVVNDGEYHFNGAADFDITKTEGKKLIAITVDDGPDGKGTREYIEIAKEFDVPFTFFVIGKNIVYNGMQLKDMLEAGCEIGNHSYNHQYLSSMSADEFKKEIEDTNNLIKKVCPEAEISFVRAPYFSYSNEMYENMGYPMIDAQLQETDSKEETLKLLETVKDGDIILMHTFNSASKEALREAIPMLKEQGFEFVTVSQLFRSRKTEPVSGSVYRSLGSFDADKYSKTENVYSGEGFASGDWGNWKAAAKVDAKAVNAMTENTALSVHYSSAMSPCIILQDWHDGPNWIQVTPSYADGEKAVFTYEDLYAAYGFGEDLSTVDNVEIRPYGADITVTLVDILK